MVTIRLTRVGKKNKPQYRIVVQDKSKSTSSNYLEKVGFYNPHDDSEAGLQLNADRIKHWISKGAETSDTDKKPGETSGDKKEEDKKKDDWKKDDKRK